VCREVPSGRTSPLGTPCDATAADNTCEGLCVSLSPGYAVCSHRCVFGDTSECVDPTAGGRVGGCLFVSPGGSIGDVGYCATLCDCSGDCPGAADVCDGFDGTGLVTAFGREGVCTDSSLAIGEILSCQL
jgi:hypothetical protein